MRTTPASSSKAAIELDFRFPALQQNDELIEAQTGASRVVIRNNTMTVDTDGIEGSWREVRADSEFVVVNNDIRSLDDLGIDVDVFSVARTVIANNVMRSHDEGVIELRGFNRGGTSNSTFDPDLGRNIRVDQPNLNWPMDLIIWNNDTHVAHNENIEVRWDMYSAEGNVYIAQNDAWGNTESEALDVALTEGAAALIERNITGFNDVDSSAAMQFGCKGAVQAIARNNIALWGLGLASSPTAACSNSKTTPSRSTTATTAPALALRTSAWAGETPTTSSPSSTTSMTPTSRALDSPSSPTH